MNRRVELHAPAPRPRRGLEPGPPRRRPPASPTPTATSRSGPAPASLRELAFIDRINEVKEPQHAPASDRLPRLYDDDYAILALLDRAGLVPPVADRPRRAARQGAQDRPPPPQQALRARPRRPRAASASASARAPTAACRGSTRSPAAGSRSPSSASRPRSTRSANGARSNSAAPARSRTTCTRSAGRSSCTGSSASSPPTTGAPRATPPAATPSRRSAAATSATRSPCASSTSPTATPSSTCRRSARSSPTSRSSCAIPSLKLTFDLLVELDLTGRPSYNHEKFLAYDAFLTGWALAHPRYRALGTRPVVVFVCRDARTALAYAREADRVMTGRIGAMGSRAARVVLRRPRPRLLRRRARHPPRLARRARAPAATARGAREVDRDRSSSNSRESSCYLTASFTRPMATDSTRAAQCEAVAHLRWNRGGSR